MAFSWRQWTPALACASALGAVPATAQTPAADPAAVVSPVEGASRFAMIRPEGSRVSRGDVVCELDRGGSRTGRDGGSLVVRQARSAYDQARLTREVAEIAVNEYVQGIFEQDRKTIEGEIALADSNRERAEDRVKWSNEMLKKGFVSPAQNHSDRLSLLQAEFSQEQVQTKMNVLQKYTKAKTTKELQSEVEKAKADELAKKATLDREEARVNGRDGNARLRAPADGVVRYGRPVDAETTVRKGEIAFRVVAEAQDKEKDKPAQAEKAFEKEVMVKVTLNYLLFRPEGYDADKGKKWPLILFLHGAGESGNDLSKVKKHGIAKVVESKSDFPFVAVSPQSSGRGWNPDALNALLDEVMKENRVDPDRVYLTGLSMGGFGTWSLAAAHPERFAAIAPICGGGNPKEAGKIKDLPIWVFHGDKDQTVPVARSKEMVEALKEAGAPEVKFTVYPEAGHDSWTETYDNPELFSWFLAHKRKGANP